MMAAISDGVDGRLISRVIQPDDEQIFPFKIFRLLNTTVLWLEVKEFHSVRRDGQTPTDFLLP